MGRKGSQLTEQRLVPFEAAQHVAYPYDRPRALHRVRLCELILLRPTWIQPVIPELAVLFYADRRVRLNLPSPRDRSSQNWRIVGEPYLTGLCQGCPFLSGVEFRPQSRLGKVSKARSFESDDLMFWDVRPGLFRDVVPLAHESF